MTHVQTRVLRTMMINYRGLNFNYRVSQELTTVVIAASDSEPGKKPMVAVDVFPQGGNTIAVVIHEDGWHLSGSERLEMIDLVKKKLSGEL